MIKTINKRCERCEMVYQIPLLKESIAKKNLLTYTPCSRCKYSPFTKNNPDKLGRCADCSIGFNIVDYHAKGRCHRCYQSYSRKNATKK